MGTAHPSQGGGGWGMVVIFSFCPSAGKEKDEHQLV